MNPLFQHLSGLDVEIRDRKAIYYLIQTSPFQELFNNSVNQEEAIKYINERNIHKLRLWIKNEKRYNIQFATVEQLRYLCSCHRIPKYQSLQREEMIELINGHRQAQVNRESETIASGTE